MEKVWRKRIDSVKDKITSGYRRGVCDSDGVTIKTAAGRPIAKPRTMGSHVKMLCNRCRKWYYRNEGHICGN
jgi:hypothetical protein